MFTDQVGQDVPHLRLVSSRSGRPVQVPERPGGLRRQAERRRARLRRRIQGADESRRHERRDHRLQLSQQLRAVGHLARRRLPERQRRSAGVPRELGDGIRQLRLLVERRPADVAGRPASRADGSGRRMAAGRSRHHAGGRRLRRRIAHRQRLLRERRARRRRGTARSSRPTRGATRSSPTSRPARAPASPSTEGLPDLERRSSSMPARTSSAATRPPRARSRRCSGRPTSRSAPTARCTSATGSTRGSAGTRISTTTLSGAIYRIAPKGFVSKVPAFDAATLEA